MSYQQLFLSDIQQNKKLSQIWDLVCEAHKGQKRKGVKNGIHPDYTNHLFKVMEIIANVWGNPKQTIQNKNLLPLFAMALTHDMIEDTAINSQEKLAWVLEPILGTSCAKNVAFVVQELSNPPQGFSGNTNQEQDEAKKIWQITHVKNISVFAKMVKMADQISNIADCVDMNMTKINKKGKRISVWSADKKESYANKALSVCQACLIGVQHVSTQQKEVFCKLMDLAHSAYDYALLKINNPLTENMEFYNTLYYSSEQQNVPRIKPLFIAKSVVRIDNGFINIR